MNILNWLFKSKKLELNNIKRWETNKCYDCGKQVEPMKCWHKFVEINNAQFSVPICNDCDGGSVNQYPTPN